HAQQAALAFHQCDEFRSCHAGRAHWPGPQRTGFTGNIQAARPSRQHARPASAHRAGMPAPLPLHLATMVAILLTCGYVALFLFLIGRWRFFEVPGLNRRSIGALFLLKVAAGTALWWVYTYYYTDRSTADIFKFFDDGNVMFSALLAHPLD